MRLVLTGMSAVLICGCLSRGSTDLLHARIREQQTHIAETERQMAMAQTELQRTRREADNLRAELARSGNGVLGAEQTEALVRVTKLQIHSLLSGGVNKASTRWALMRVSGIATRLSCTFAPVRTALMGTPQQAVSRCSL